ncbi:hypothetical protein [Tolypothrix sp. VBCCA 56010]|uniref:hypothetical protein n=1 Tax=Tolypothrix sp. VBCCA 56010 TaxID=3137731 RepID=UPI003D7E38B2
MLIVIVCCTVRSPLIRYITSARSHIGAFFEPLQSQNQQLRPAGTLPTQCALLVAGFAVVLDRCLLAVLEVLCLQE